MAVSVLFVIGIVLLGLFVLCIVSIRQTQVHLVSTLRNKCRCPECQYTYDREQCGVCPECGRSPVQAEEWIRVKARHRLIVLFPGLIGLGVSLAALLIVAAPLAVRHLPTNVILNGVHNFAPKTAWDTLVFRSETGKIQASEAALLRSRCRQVLTSSGHPCESVAGRILSILWRDRTGSIEDLALVLAHRNPEVQAHALHVVEQQIGLLDEPTTFALASTIKMSRPDQQVQKANILTISGIPSGRTVRQLQEVLAQSDVEHSEEVRNAIHSAIYTVALDDSKPKFILDGLRSADPHTRASAAWALARSGVPVTGEWCDELTEMIRLGSVSQVGSFIIMSIWKSTTDIDCECSIQMSLSALSAVGIDDDAKVAAFDIVRRGCASDREQLVAMRDIAYDATFSASGSVRSAAARVIAMLPSLDSRLAGRLRELLNDDKYLVRVAAREGLERHEREE